MDMVAVGPEDEALLLDLLNTTPVVNGEARDDLAQHTAARSWMRERGIVPTGVELAGLLDVRSVLQAVVRGEQTGSWRWTVGRAERCALCWRGMPCVFPARDGCGRVPTPNAGCS